MPERPASAFEKSTTGDIDRFAQLLSSDDEIRPQHRGCAFPQCAGRWSASPRPQLVTLALAAEPRGDRMLIFVQGCSEVAYSFECASGVGMPEQDGRRLVAVHGCGAPIRVRRTLPLLKRFGALTE